MSTDEFSRILPVIASYLVVLAELHKAGCILTGCARGKEGTLAQEWGGFSDGSDLNSHL